MFYLNKIVLDINQASNIKLCWQAINRLKRKPEIRLGQSNPQDWVKHFKTLLNSPLIAQRNHYAEPLTINSLLDDQLFYLCIRRVIAIW